MNARARLLGALAWALLAPLGGLLVLLGERVWPGTAPAPWLAALGAAALLAGLGLSLAPHPRRPARPWLAAPYALFLLALALYYAGRALAGEGAAGGAGGTAPAWHDLARGGWMLAATAGAVLHGFLTLALLAQRHIPRSDPRRIARAGAAGLSLALLLLLVALLNFVLARQPWHWNVAYFRTTQPGAATLEAAGGLSEPVQVGVFFAADSGVAPLIRGYFETLRRRLDGATPLTVQHLDADLQPAQADAFEARGNGWVVLRKEGLLRPIHVGETLERARAALRTFDGTFYAKLLEVSRPRRVVYLTVGHGERAERGGRADPVGALDRLRTLLRERNYAVKELGIGEGLGDRIPDDAALIVAAAPRMPFLPGEAAALRRWLDGGGRLLALLEPRASGERAAPPGTGGLPGEPLKALLRDYGVEFQPVPLANDRFYGRRTYTQADHALLVTVRYENHPSVNALRRVASQAPLLLLGAGALEAGPAPEGLAVQPTLRAMPGTWADRDGNFAFDPSREVRGEPILGLAIGPPAPGGALSPTAKTPGPSLLVYADADLVGDLLLQNRANQQLLEDGLGWLLGQDAPVGPPESEEDVRIRHARDDDWLWFYLPVLGVPALVLGLGAYRVGRPRRRGDPPGPPGLPGAAA